MDECRTDHDQARTKRANVFHDVSFLFSPYFQRALVTTLILVYYGA